MMSDFHPKVAADIRVCFLQALYRPAGLTYQDCLLLD